MTSQTVIVLLTGLLLGAVAGAVSAWLLSRSRRQVTDSTTTANLAEARAAAERARAEVSDAKAETANVRAELASQRELVAQHRADVANAHADRAEAQAAISEARSDTAQTKALLSGALAEKQAALAQVAAMQADQQRMVNEFKVLSAEQLARQGKSADDAAAERQKAVEALVTPLTQQLKDFHQRVSEIEKERVTLATELREQVKQVTLTGDQVRRETASLATALRKPQTRGQWGELQLKRVAEIAGMVEHCHFVLQGTTTTSSETTIRPDMTIMLGEDKFVHVDSKVPLSAFLDAQETEDEGEHERLLGQFTKNVRTHVDQLSGKQYWKSQAGTPEFVIMFIPAEALFAEAVSRMPDLLQYASEKSIIIANPSSLIAILKTVSYSWRQAGLAENAMQVFTLARELHERLGKLGSHVDKLGRALGGAVKAYNDSVGSFESRVLPSARKLRDLNVTDLEIATPARLDTDVRSLSAPEFLEAAEHHLAITTGADEAVDLELTRPDPTLDELIEDTNPASQDPTPRLRSLG